MEEHDLKYDLDVLDIGEHNVLVCYLHVENVPPDQIMEYINHVRSEIKRILPGTKVIVVGKYGLTTRTTFEAIPRDEIIELLEELR